MVKGHFWPHCSLPSAALDNLPALPLTLPSMHRYPLAPSNHLPPKPTGPWGYHLWIHLCPHSPAQLSHRISHTQTVNDNSVRAFHIPYTHFPPLTISKCSVTHSLTLLLHHQRLPVHPTPQLARVASILLIPAASFFSSSFNLSVKCLGGLFFFTGNDGLKRYIATAQTVFHLDFTLALVVVVLLL